MNLSVPGATIAGMIMRWAIGLASGYLIGHHVIAENQVPAFTQDALAAIPAGAVLVWSYREKVAAKLKQIAAALTGQHEPNMADPNIKAQATAVAKAAAVVIALTLACQPLAGCAALTSAAQKAQTAIHKNAVAIDAVCKSKIIPIAQSTGADLLAMAFGPVAQAQASAVNACNAIDEVAASSTTVAWLVDQATIMLTKGAVLPSPIAPAPVSNSP